jgi:hypothetical protein
MIKAQGSALAHGTNQGLIAIRQSEIDYYTSYNEKIALQGFDAI